MNIEKILKECSVKTINHSDDITYVIELQTSLPMAKIKELFDTVKLSLPNNASLLILTNGVKLSDFSLEQLIATRKIINKEISKRQVPTKSIGCSQCEERYNCPEAHTDNAEKCGAYNHRIDKQPQERGAHRLLGIMRDLTEDERVKYNKIIDKLYEPTEVNIFDLDEEKDE